MEVSEVEGEAAASGLTVGDGRPGALGRSLSAWVTAPRASRDVIVPSAPTPPRRRTASVGDTLAVVDLAVRQEIAHDAARPSRLVLPVVGA
ncbi:hypothetical protein ACFU53_07195 [Streptomyces sp. NPDC057474]|uniref:hypothetical protein n=1 Tax=Streptomyces sp. NPDC057474 TaxID=3346144 RepID=UPI0036BD8BDA